MSKIDALKSSILNYTHHMGTYDYVAYAWLIILFFVAILLAIIVAKKNSLLSIIIVIISLILLLIGPFVLQHYLNKYLRASVVETTSVKRLKFSDTLIVTGYVKNISKKSFSTCSIDIDIIKGSSSEIKRFIYKLKPLIRKTIYIDSLIDINATEDFNAVFDEYRVNEDINVSIKSECY